VGEEGLVVDGMDLGEGGGGEWRGVGGEEGFMGGEEETLPGKRIDRSGRKQR
jgi:hypothetical protein